jgi:hypothetical protein
MDSYSQATRRSYLLVVMCSYPRMVMCSYCRVAMGSYLRVATGSYSQVAMGGRSRKDHVLGTPVIRRVAVKAGTEPVEAWAARGVPGAELPSRELRLAHYFFPGESLLRK